MEPTTVESSAASTNVAATTSRGHEVLGRIRKLFVDSANNAPRLPLAAIDGVSPQGTQLAVRPSFGRGEVAGYAATLPRSAAGRLTLETSGMSIDVTVDDLAPSNIEFAQHVAIYPDVGNGTHLLRVVLARGIEDFFAVDDARDAFTASYTISLHGVAGLRLLDGQLELLDDGGAPRLRIPRPVLHDTRGATRVGDLRVTGCAFDTSPTLPWGRPVTRPGASECHVSARFDTRGLAFPILVDPAWETTTSNTSQTHAYHKLLRLTGAGEAGKVLLVGGTGTVPGLTEAYDPTTKSWASAGSFADSVTLGIGMNAVVLDDGSVVASGGFPISGGSTAQANTEFRKPGGAWQHGSVMPTGRAWHAMVPITFAGKSQALILGGQPNTSIVSTPPIKNVEAFDPNSGSSGSWTSTASMSRSRTKHRAVVLADGKVLVAGGEDYSSGTVYLESSEIFDPTVTVGSAWTAGPNMASKRTQLELVALPAGGAVAAGGSSSGSAFTALDTLEYFDGAKWTTLTAKMSSTRWQFASSVLADGRVLYTGGQSYGTSSFINDTADLLIPGPTPATTATVSGAGSMRITRQFHSSVTLPGLGVLVAGGQATTTTGTETAYTDFFNTAVGGVCSVGGTACPTGLSCVDGVCCASTGCPEGQTCAAPGREGVCTKPKGTTCTANSECATGYCVTGVCCESACSGGCKACNEVGKEGTCVLAPAGTDPGAFCQSSSDVTCARKCDGTGKCSTSYAAEGTPCGASLGDAGTGKFCTTYACSAYGSCFSKTNNCGLTCTTSVTCDETTKTCSATASGIKAGQCLIAGQCYAYGDINPKDSCQVCDPPTNKLGWSTAASCLEGGVDTGSDEDTSSEDTGSSDDSGMIEDTSTGDDTGLDAGEDASTGPSALPEASTCGCRVPGRSTSTRGGTLAALGIALLVVSRRRKSA